MAGTAPPRKSSPSPNGAPTLTPLGHYAGRPDIAISRQVTVVGSKPGSRLHLASSTVSKNHALIVNAAAGAYVRDLASRTHVIVNGKDHKEADLDDGDLVQIGKFKFQFNAGVTGAGLVQPGRSAPVGDFDPPPGAILNVDGGEMPLPIEDRTVLIGRRPTCDIPLIEDAVSTTHAVVFEMNGKRFIRDLGSRTGTFVNGQKVDQIELKFGDEIRIGETNIVYASATGEVAPREVDEMDHLVGTAPLGTAALELPELADDAGPRRDERESGAVGEADAIPLGDEGEEKRGDDGLAAMVEAESRAEDQIRLDSDPDVSGGPGETAVLPAARAEDKPRKLPTLRTEPLDEDVRESKTMPAADAAAAAARAQEIEDELGGSRRGWRGMTSEEPHLPLADHPVAAEPESEAQAAPEPEPEPEPLPPVAAEAEAVEEEGQEPIVIEPVAAAPAPAPAPPQTTPPHVTVGEEVDALPAETFDVHEHDDAPVAELHLPPPPDEGPVEPEIEPLALTPEEGAPLDLSVDESEIVEEEPPPVLNLGEPEPPRQREPETLELSADVPDETPAVAKPAPAPAPPEPEPVATEPEPESAPAGTPKRKRPPRKKKDVEPPAEALPVAEQPADVEPFAPPLEPVAEAGSGSVEVFDETQPTPESALDIDDAVAEMLAETLPVEQETLESAAGAAAGLTDTGFGRAVDSFVGESTGPLVESRDDAAAPEVEAEAPAEAEAAPVLPGVEEQLVQPEREAEAFDDMLADALAEEPAAVAEAATPTETADVESLDLAIEEAAAAEPVAEEAPAEAGVADVDVDTEPAPEPAVAEAREPEVAEEPEPSLAEAAEPAVAEEPPPEPEPSQPDAPELAQPVAKDEPPPAPAAPMIGANQEHFLGGMPLKLNKPLKPAAPGGAGGAGAAAAARGRAPMMPPPPPRATRPNARTRSPFEAGPGDASMVGDLGATIPPYRGKSPTAGQVTTGFDGLAMPPVRQTDVFSQMSTPAAFAAGLSGAFDEDIFSRGEKAARQPQQPLQQPPQPQQKQSPPPAPPAQPPPAREPDLSESASPDDTIADTVSPADPVWSDDTAHGAPPPDVESETETPADEQHPVGAAAATDGDRRRSRDLPTPPAFPEPAPEPQAPPKRKRRWFGLRLLLVLMLLFALGAAGGIYGFVKKQTNVVGKLRFDNAEALKAIEQQQLLNEQKQLLGEHALREEARRLLAQRQPGLAPGFLADPVAYEAAARKADWAADQKGALAFPYSGTDERGDGTRVHAVMLALYDANVKQAGNGGAGGGGLRATVESLTAAHTKSQQRVNDLKAQIERLNVTAQRMPQRQQLEERRAEVARLEKTYDDARRAAKDVADEVERMQKGLPANPQPAGTAQAPLTDAELAKMQEELAATSRKLEAAKAARAKSADEAQAALGKALQQFQKQIAGAQGVAKDNPELSAYVTAAQKLQTSTRDLTEQLIRRQQQQQQQLAELKARLSEKLEARRADAWKKDAKLKQFEEDLAIVQRQYSAAMGGGAKKEAEEFRAQIDLLEQMIKARQTLVEDDPFYADAIAQLQRIIDDQQRGIDNDRKRTEAVLEEMQATFTKSQPAVEKMPEAQKQLAATLEKELANVNAARRQYTQAADAAAAAGDEEMKKMEASAAALATKIDARRKELAAQAEKVATAEQEQGRLKAMKDRQADLVAAQAKELEAQKAWGEARTALREMESLEAEAREAGERRDAHAAERVDAEKELAAQLRQLELKSAEAKRTVEPIAPTEADVEVSIHDPRPTYALAGVGGIVAVFTLLILFTAAGSGAAADDAPPVADLSPFDARPTPMPIPRPNGGVPETADEDAPRVAV